MINLKTLEETSIVCDKNPKIHKYYVYTYTLNGKIKYVGRGSDAHEKEPYYRARHIKGHSHSPECLLESGNLLVTVVDHASTIEEAKLIEANYIKAFGTVKNGWNNIKGLRDNKFYDLLDTFIKREDGSSIDVKTLVHLLMQNATGEKGVEPDKLARDIISKVDIDEDKDICVISNNQFGGFNLVKELINPNVEKKSLNMIVTEEFAMKIGADDMADKEFLTINTGHENFIHQDFGSKKFDIIFQNPPWITKSKKLPGGRVFINKAISLLKPGGILVTIVGLVEFTKEPNKKGIVYDGSFQDLQNRGSFKRIETFAVGSDRDYFKNVVDWCWFIWKKEKTDITKETTIITRAGEELSLKLDPLKNIHIPQLKNEEDYFTWDLESGIKWSWFDKGEVIEEDGLFIVPRGGKLRDGIREVDNINLWDIVAGDLAPNCGRFYQNVDYGKFEEFTKIIPNLYELYAVTNPAGKFRTPYLRKDIFEKVKNEQL